MAAITMNTADIRNGVQFLEDVTMTDGVATGFTAGVKTRGLAVPPWATKLVLTLFVDSMAGTTELIDFAVGVPDWGSLTLLGAPTDGTDVSTIGNAAWNGITQITAAGPSQVVMEFGPDVTDDDTGSATASCYYGIKVELPPVITYTITLNVGDADEDYAFRLAAMWR